MNPKKQFKILPLSFPFILEKDLWEDCLEEENRIEPIFNRNGFYLDRYTNFTWLEINGEAWKYRNRNSFIYSLKIQGPLWNEDKLTAIKTASQYLPYKANRNLLDELKIQLEIRMIRKTHRDTKLECRKILKNIRQK